MDSKAKLLLNSYAQLVELSDKQVTTAGKPRYDEQLMHIHELEQLKKSYQNEIELISQNKAEYDHIVANHRNEITALISRLQAQINQLQEMISNWYREDSHIMKQVSDQRRTLQSYGGVNNSDVISYYFDEKK